MWSDMWVVAVKNNFDERRKENDIEDTTNNITLLSSLRFEHRL